MKYLLFICVICLSSTLSAQVVDQDGYTYKTVIIGEQEWFAENLRTSKYNDATPIPNGTDDNWSNLLTGAYCFYDNNAANNAVYGKLYNWYAVETDKLCPIGWHVPTDAEWTTLENYLGERRASKKMKSTTGWFHGHNGTNSSGFSALPGGFRNGFGTFEIEGVAGGWWSSTEDDAGDVYYRYLDYYRDSLSRYDGNKGRGFSVRCLRD